MKTRMFFHLLIFAALVLSACTQSVTALQESGKTPNAEMELPADLTGSEADQTVTGNCNRSSDEVRLLINSVHRYCLQYPAEYDVFFPNESEIVLFKLSILNVSEPSVQIMVQPAGGMTVDQAADSFLAVYTLLESDLVRESLTIDGEQAIMLDRLPGQDINRQVFVVHNDYLYQLSFLPMDENQLEVYAQAEALYNTVVNSFNFRPASNACPDCPAPEEDPQLLPGVGMTQQVITAQLDSVGDSGVSGTATLIAAGDGTNVELDIKGLAPGVDARSAMHAGTCAMPSASFTTLPDLKADATGRATATGSVLFRGAENVTLAAIADGEHIIAIQADGQVVACGVISKLTP